MALATKRELRRCEPRPINERVSSEIHRADIPNRIKNEGPIAWYDQSHFHPLSLAINTACRFTETTCITTNLIARPTDPRPRPGTSCLGSATIRYVTGRLTIIIPALNTANGLVRPVAQKNVPPI